MLGRVAALAIALALALAAATCGDDEDPPDRTTSTTASGSSSTAPSPEDEVEAAYLAYRAMVTRLLEDPNPDDEEIGQRAVGENRDFLVDRLTTLNALGQALRFGPAYDYSVESVSVTGSDAVVRDCTVDDAQTITVATAEVVSEGTSTQLLEASLVLEGNAWRVRTVDSVGTWPGVTSCDD